MSDLMTFPDTVEEFMEQYKVTDTEQVYSNGAEYVPIFRMKQWFEHLTTAEPRRGTWAEENGTFICSACGSGFKDQPTCIGKPMFLYCPLCGAKMEN